MRGVWTALRHSKSFWQMSDNDKNAVMTDGFTVTAFSERSCRGSRNDRKRSIFGTVEPAAIRDLFLGGCVTSDIADGASGGESGACGSISALACEAPDGTLAAYGGIECVLDEANIVNIATSPEYRRRGCARAVMGGLLDIAKKKGCTRVTLEVREHNLPAQALYRSFGFTPPGIRKHFYSFPDENAIVMEKYLVKE